MPDLLAARAQMGTSLAFHIVFAALGVGLPLLLCIQATLRSIIVLLLPALSLRHLQIHFSFFTELFHK